MSIAKGNLKKWGQFYPAQAAFLTKVKKNPNFSIQDSIKQAEKSFSALHLIGVNVLYVFGVGRGCFYNVAKKWLHAEKNRTLVFFEDDPQAILSLFETRQGYDILDDRQVRLFFWGEVDREDTSLAQLIRALAFEKYVFTALESYAHNRVAAVSQLESKLAYYVDISKVAGMEHLRFGFPFIHNFYQNLPALSDSYLGNKMFGQFQNTPAIICGAGPSLAKNFHTLETLKERALIFAGGTAMNALNAQGFLPHFGVGVDPHPTQVTRLLANQAYQVPFFYRSRMNARALSLVHGDRLYLAGSGGHSITKWVEEQLGIHEETISEGHNVVNLSLSIAHALGCNPIIFVGVDLAYTEKQSYASGVLQHALHESKQHFFTKTEKEELVPKKDIYGKPVYTLWKWIKEANWFAHFAKDRPETKLINATEGGIGFPGIPNMPLHEVAEQYLQKECDLQQHVHEAIQKSQMPEKVTHENIFNTLHVLFENLKECNEMCKKLCEIYAEIKESPESTLKDEASLCIDKLQKEIGYIYLLRDMRDGFWSVFGERIDYLARDPDWARDYDVMRERADVMFQLYRYLQQATSVNMNLIEMTIKQTNQPVQHQPIDATNLQGKKQFYASGALYRIVYEDGKQEYFYENGHQKTILCYKNGNLDGEVLLFYPDGKKHRQLHFSHGKRHGTENMWNTEGTLMIEAEYRDDHPVGTARSWHDNGQLEMEVIYDDAGQTKKVQSWDVQGKLIPGKREDYFEAVATHTERLSGSLEKMLATVEKVITSENQETLKHIQEEMQQLQKIKEDLIEKSKGAGEAIWKSPSAKEKIEKQLQEVTRRMEAELEKIQKLLEKAMHTDE